MSKSEKKIRIFLCGDVMTGRGIDQILPHPNRPKLMEYYVKDARQYIYLAEAVNGKIQYPVAYKYIWGDALTIWQRYQPTIKIINLETSITESNDYWPDKGIHYRMHPHNAPVLTAAGIDICTLANNHILDLGYKGLTETLATLKNINIQFCGAGENITQAMQPAVHELTIDKRVLVFSVGTASSGIPDSWAATSQKPGVYFLSHLNDISLSALTDHIQQYRQPGDLIILSIHWGSNWGYEIPESFRFFAQGVIEQAKVNLIFGHSSHHPRAIELYGDTPILYGCGDFINDYEGISGYESYHPELSYMYFFDFDLETLHLIEMKAIPLWVKKFRLTSL